VVKFDDDPVRPSIRFKKSIVWEIPLISVYGVVQLALVIGSITSLIQGRLVQGLGIIGGAIFVCVMFIWYWREWRGRTTVITIADEYVLIEEYKRKVAIYEKRIITNQIHNVYCKCIWGRGPFYEVRMKMHNEQDQYIVPTEQSKVDAITIRHFLASHLNVDEVL